MSSSISHLLTDSKTPPPREDFTASLTRFVDQAITNIERNDAALGLFQLRSGSASAAPSVPVLPTPTINPHRHSHTHAHAHPQPFLPPISYTSAPPPSPPPLSLPPLPSSSSVTTATLTALASPPTHADGVLKPVRQFKVKKYFKQVPSQHCHICRRSANVVPTITCRNIRRGLCRKVACRKCFDAFGWDFDAAAAASAGGLVRMPEEAGGAVEGGGAGTGVRVGAGAGAGGSDEGAGAANGNGGWVCTHCRDACPPKAQCFIYQRVNTKRKMRLLERDAVAKRDVSVAAATAAVSATHLEA